MSKKKKRRKQVIKIINELSIATIFEMIDEAEGKSKHIYINGYKHKVSNRLKMFRKYGIECVRCSAYGDKFQQIITNVGRTLSLVTHDEILMTKDHIIPLSRGGADTLLNLQPMCTVCNQKKGNNTEGVEKLFVTSSICGFMNEKLKDSPRCEHINDEFVNIVKDNIYVAPSEVKEISRYIRGRYGFGIPIKKVAAVPKKRVSNGSWSIIS